MKKTKPENNIISKLLLSFNKNKNGQESQGLQQELQAKLYELDKI